MEDLEETPWPPKNLCPVCEGYGRIWREDDGTPDFLDDEGVPCAACDGSGLKK